MIAKAQLPDPFEESWEGSVHNLIYVDYDVTRGAKYQIKNRENNRREIKFTGWVFTAKRLSLSIKNRKLVSCQVMEVFGQSINLTMDVFDGSSVYPHTLSNCKDWIGKFEER